MYDLYNELMQKQSMLLASLKLLRQNGTSLAERERNYKMALHDEVLKLRDSGLAVGLIDKVIYGVPRIADLRLKRDIAKTVYEANQEAINVYKLEMRIIENQLSREWGNAKNE